MISGVPRDRLIPNRKNKGFALQSEHLPAGFLVADLCPDDQRHLVFATEKQLKVLAKAKVWYIDGTFKLLKKPFMQVFSVHAFVRKGKSIKQVPLAFSLMTRRKEEDYVAVLEAMVSALPKRPRCRRVVLDYERAAWNALRRVLPSRVNLRGCAFHFTQAILKQIRQNRKVASSPRTADTPEQESSYRNL